MTQPTCHQDDPSPLQPTRIDYPTQDVSLWRFLSQSLLLLAPIVMPSWRFFDEIAPSPRIEYRLLTSPELPHNNEDLSLGWHRLSPIPERLALLAYIGRLFLNPDWNERLFLMSNSERLMQYDSAASYQRLLQASQKDAKTRLFPAPTHAALFLQFRLVFISKDQDSLRRDVAFVSAAHPFTL
jgi:hypothetical protein